MCVTETTHGRTTRRGSKLQLLALSDYNVVEGSLDSGETAEQANVDRVKRVRGRTVS